MSGCESSTQHAGVRAQSDVLYQKLGRQEGVITLWDMPDIATLQQRTKIPVQYIDSNERDAAARRWDRDRAREQASEGGADVL